MRTNPIRPLLRWAGSKREALHRLAPYYPGCGRYIEPFAGSASLFFYLEPHLSILGDANKHVIDLYASVRRAPVAVWSAWSSMPVSKDFYLQLRARAFAEADPVQRAANFLYLNRNCFNGIFRVNKHGRFNVPFSGCRTGRLPSLEDFTESAKILWRAQLFNSDFEVLVTAK